MKRQLTCPSTRRFTNLLTGLLAVALTGTLAAQDGQKPDPRAAKARELMELMEIEKNLDASFAHVEKFADGIIESQELPPEEAEQARKAARASMQASFKSMREIDWAGMFADIYAEVFTVEELDGLIDFYKSPVGRKFLEKQPELMGATMKKMQAEFSKIMPEIQKEVERAIEEAQQDSR